MTEDGQRVAVPLGEFRFLYELQHRLHSVYTPNDEMLRLFLIEGHISEWAQRRYGANGRRTTSPNGCAISPVVLLSSEEFRFLVDAFDDLAQPYTHDDVVRLLRRERLIWSLLQEVAAAQLFESDGYWVLKADVDVALNHTER